MKTVTNSIVIDTEKKTKRRPRWETNYDAAVKEQWALEIMRTGEEPELPSAMEKRIGVEEAKKKMLALKAELEQLQMP